MADSEEIKVYITPLIQPGVYGSEIEVTDFINTEDITEIRLTSDSEDYTVGLFVFGDLDLTVDNHSGQFSSESDPRSIFITTRNLAKVRIAFNATTITRDSNNNITSSVFTETTIFRGLINEEGTRENALEEEIIFKILSYDSVIRSEKIPAGTIPNSTLASDAIKFILNKPRITSILTFNPSNINLNNDFTIDVGSEFDNLNSFDALSQLLEISNSVLIINSSLAIIVRDRLPDAVASTLNLYGPFDEYSRGNIISLNNFNNGLHRTFNSIKINNTEVNDSDSISEFGARQKEINRDFLTTDATETTLANSILTEFKNPRDECEVEVPFSVGKDAILFQKVSINWPLRFSVGSGEFAAIVGQTKYGDSEMTFPTEHGSLEISPNEQWKIIEKIHNVQDRTITMKLRQTLTGYTA